MLKWPKWFVKRIQPWVQGKDVWDMGAGPSPTPLARLLLKAGASSVTSVEKEGCYSATPAGPSHRIDCMRMENIRGPIDVALISWPLVPLSTGSMPWSPLAKTIIYVGVNDKDTVCYMPGLYGELSKRELLFHHDGRGKNRRRGPTQDIIVAGDRTMATPYSLRYPVKAEIGLLSSLVAMQRLNKEIRDDRIQQIDGT